MKKECRCHGVSGSCELQICRLQPSKLTDISTEIYRELTEQARFVQTRDEIESSQTIFYARRSINYCRSNTFLDYEGVRPGRECFSSKGCEQVCCQRGYEIRTETKLIPNCECAFSWNIVNVQCKPCEKKFTRMICT